MEEEYYYTLSSFTSDGSSWRQANTWDHMPSLREITQRLSEWMQRDYPSVIFNHDRVVLENFVRWTEKEYRAYNSTSNTDIPPVGQYRLRYDTQNPYPCALCVFENKNFCENFCSHLGKGAYFVAVE